MFIQLMLMDLAQPLLDLATVESGSDRWSQIVEGLRRNVEEQRALIPVVGWVLLGIGVIGLNIAVARWLLRQNGGRR